MDQSIFKAYDIRGTYPQELDKKTAFDIGAAFAKYTKAKNIMVGEDARRSSPVLRGALIKGIVSTGANVIFAGCATTPLFYFAVASNKTADAGIMVTASHNPSKYNGFKLVWGDATPIQPAELLPLIGNPKSQIPNPKKISNSKQGKITKINILDAYVKKVLSLVDVKKIRPMKIVIDAGNGTAGITVEKLLQKLPQIKIKKLFFGIDMSFPNHEANPMKEENLASLKDAVKKERAALGAAYDGDADRIGFVDENGDSARADFIFAAILPELLNHKNIKTLKHEDEETTVLYDLRSSKIVPEIIKKLGGKPRMTRVGHAFIKKDMTKYKAVAASELSAHYYFKDFFGAECSDLVLLCLLKVLSERNQPLSQIIAPMKKYCQSGEINFEVSDKDAVISDILKKYRKEANDFTDIDGIRLDFQSQNDWWWVSVRASNTEPLLRLNIEASDKKLLAQKMAALTKIIKK